MAKIEVENVSRPGSTYSVDAAKAAAMKPAYPAVLQHKAPPGMTVAAIGERLLSRPSDGHCPGVAQAGWWPSRFGSNSKQRGWSSAVRTAASCGCTGAG